MALLKQFLIKLMMYLLYKLSILWSFCVGFGVDNTSVNIGLHNSIMTHVRQKNDTVYFMGCPCHLLHNVGSHASEAFQQVSSFDIKTSALTCSIGLTRVLNARGFFKNSVIFVILAIVKLCGMSM